MKRLRGGQKKFQLELDRPEKDLLFHILQLYPAVPASHHRLSQDRQFPNREENQHLLEEALKAQRVEQRKKIKSLLKDPRRFVASGGGYRISFTREEIEWLLQVLNDVRVGSWLALGSPDPQQGPQKRVNNLTAPHVIAMELAGYFEVFFLSAVNGDRPPGHE